MHAGSAAVLALIDAAEAIQSESSIAVFERQPFGGPWIALFVRMHAGR